MIFRNAAFPQRANSGDGGYEDDDDDGDDDYDHAGS